ncbi:MAG TPA: helix-turn-helix domain-containing protein [Thermoanaerobaculia bacterium]|nr:helix-turn-helix domain-containing protein [Thermoanaerobaculia bacterium]
MTAEIEESTREPYRAKWASEVRWYLWDGGFLAIGRADGVVPPHAHHAIQIVFSVTGESEISGESGDWRTGRGIVVMPDVTHRYNGNGMFGAMLFVDPESAEGTWLRATMRQDITIVPAARVDLAAAELQRFLDEPFAAMDIRTLIRYCVTTLCVGVPPARKLDERVTRVLQEIRESGDLRISLESIAAKAFLSPSRFQHLFKQQVGLPFRRYMLWRKLTRAMMGIARERTLTAAAQASDFADAAHLTRTFYQMFGIAPSLLMQGDFFVIDSPFDAT